MTETTRTAAMPNATDRPTNSRISVLVVCCAWTAVKNCALVLIQLSASTGMEAWISLRERLGRVDVLHRQIDRRDAADQIEQRLRGPQRHVGGCADWRPCCRDRRCR